jgi:hypothetical protein
MAGYVAHAVRVLEALVVGTRHIAASDLKTPSIDAGGAVGVLLAVSRWRLASVDSAHRRNSSRSSVGGAGWAFRGAVVFGNARSAGLAPGWTIPGAGGTVSEVVAGIGLATGRAIRGAGRTASVTGTGMENGT